MINEYEFGKMKVEGTLFTDDLKIFPERVIPNWRRTEGHLLQVQDLKDVFEQCPDKLIIGTGASGNLDVDDAVIQRLKRLNIDYKIRKTGVATEIFNNEEGGVVGVFHLTC